MSYLSSKPGGGSTGHTSSNETPTGVINGSNKDFTLAHTPDPVGSLQLFLNGALQQAGGGDYTLTGNAIAFVNAPLTGSILIAYYTYA